jgi:hypothetical protein
MAKKSNDNNYAPDGVKVRRPGVHAKSKTSTFKTSKNYANAERGHGK